MGHYTNKCLNEINKAVCKWNGSRLTISLLIICLSVFSFSSAPVLAGATTGAAETVTGTHPPHALPPPVRPRTPLLPAVHLEAPAPACVC